MVLNCNYHEKQNLATLVAYPAEIYFAIHTDPSCVRITPRRIPSPRSGQPFSVGIYLGSAFYLVGFMDHSNAWQQRILGKILSCPVWRINPVDRLENH